MVLESASCTLLNRVQSCTVQLVGQLHVLESPSFHSCVQRIMHFYASEGSYWESQFGMYLQGCFPYHQELMYVSQIQYCHLVGLAFDRQLQHFRAHIVSTGHCPVTSVSNTSVIDCILYVLDLMAHPQSTSHFMSAEFSDASLCSLGVALIGTVHVNTSMPIV